MSPDIEAIVLQLRARHRTRLTAIPTMLAAADIIEMLSDRCEIMQKFIEEQERARAEAPSN